MAAMMSVPPMVASRRTTREPEIPTMEAPAAAETKGSVTPKFRPLVRPMARESNRVATRLNRTLFSRRNLQPTSRMGIFSRMIKGQVGSPVM